MENEIVKIQGVKQSFHSGFLLKSVEVLHGIDMSIERNKILGLLGPNGAGKTTLIQLIAGLRSPTQGKITINGKITRDPMSRLEVGYLPERPYFYEHLTGEKLLTYAGVLSGMDSHEIEKRIKEVLEIVDMSHARYKELRHYSKGMLQRIGIAQAILHNPSFLLLDEPMSGLDPIGRKDMRNLIMDLFKDGKSIMFSSHIVFDIEEICHDVSIIKNGNMVGQGPISKFISQGILNSEIVFKSKSNEINDSIKNLGNIEKSSEGFKIIVNEESVSSTIKTLIDNASQIVRVTPIKPSLEDIFGEEDES